MASFRPRKLVDRIEAQGWRIEHKKDGWMCYPPDKLFGPVLIHRSPSDENWHKQALRLLKARGFVDG